MSFLIQRVAGRNLTLSQIRGDVLRIGRGTNQNLRSENPAVALEHAVIQSDAAGYVITDRGSITGTYVNGRPVETARLAKGDTIEIGDLWLEVQLADPAKPLFLRSTVSRASSGMLPEEQEEAAAATPGAGVVRARKIDYVSSYRLRRPWITKLSLTALLLIVALAVVGEVIRPEKQALFMPGGLSSAHARARDPRGRAVAEDCKACHSPFNGVSNSKCLGCHAQQPHAEYEASAPDCFSCHAEHRGAVKLSAISDATCVGCHADLGSHMRVAEPQRAALRFADSRYGFAKIARVKAFDDSHPELSYPRDTNTLRFNHKLHLNERGVFNAQGKREVLECTGCHELVTTKGKADPRPIEFERDCQRCHRLTFDARYPTSEVPHGGEPGIVYGFVLATYSGDRDIAGKPAAEVRRILSARKSVAPDQRAVLNAEQVVKTKCRLCHEISRNGSRLAVTPPAIPAQWLTRARFTHGRHANIECARCHENARQSVPTSDVLMPKLSDCTGCHAANDGKTQVASTCVTCHEYHFRPSKQVVSSPLTQAGVGGLGSGGRMLQGILLAVIVVLLLVVLVPVGIALFQRLRPEARVVAPSVPARPAPPPPPAADAPTDRVSRAAAPPPDLAPRVATTPEPDATRVMAVERPNADAPAGTEMMQWNGMLHCTSGPLEGQRFVIEDDGFYIGRDPGMSTIVIPDSRISKRHLRILPRDGKVFAIDEGSTNGTFLRDQRITEVQLKRGDTLVLGDNAATFVYQI